MRTASAQHPLPPDGADRLFITDRAAIVLDGASAFTARDISAGAYAERLGATFADLIGRSPTEPLTSLLAAAIQRTATALGVPRGERAPSSTVAACRYLPDGAADLLVLGDSQIAWAQGQLRDDRLASVATAQRAAYRSRLEAGSGYDTKHRELLADLQREQLRQRNRDGGYWIAEADPAAAEQAFTARLGPEQASWCVLATDGTYRPLSWSASDDWQAIARLSDDDLGALLMRCHELEDLDPDGRIHPRAKRHDDKTIAVLHAR